MEIGAALATLTDATNASSKGLTTLNDKLKTFSVVLHETDSPLTRTQENIFDLKKIGDEYSAANDTIFKTLETVKSKTDDFSGSLGTAIGKLKKSRDYVAGLGKQYPQLGKVLKSTGIDMDKLSAIGDKVIAVHDQMIGGLQTVKTSLGLYSEGFGKAQKVVAFFRLENLKANIEMVKLRFNVIKTTAVTKALAAGQGIKAFGTTLLTFSRTAIPTAVAGLRALTVAVITNPIGALLTVVGLAIAGVAVTIYKYWQPIQAFVSGVWQGFKNALSPVMESLQPLTGILSPIGDLFTWVGDAVAWVVGSFKDLLTPVQAGSESMAAMSASGQRVGEVIGAAFKALFAPIIFVTKGIGLLGDLWNNFFGSDEDSKKELTLTTKKVNELTTSVSSAPALEQANALVAAQGQSTRMEQTNNNQIVINAPANMDSKKLAEEVAREIQYRQDVNRRAALNDGAL